VPDNAITTYFDYFRVAAVRMTWWWPCGSRTRTRIRIDTLPHAVSAVVRGLDLLPPDPPGFGLADAMRDFGPR
jgi:hypothetical protein